jgi:hypothetical protein
VPVAVTVNVYRLDCCASSVPVKISVGVVDDGDVDELPLNQPHPAPSTASPRAMEATRKVRMCLSKLIIDTYHIESRHK